MLFWFSEFYEVDGYCRYDDHSNYCNYSDYGVKRETCMQTLKAKRINYWTQCDVSDVYVLWKWINASLGCIAKPDFMLPNIPASIKKRMNK